MCLSLILLALNFVALHSSSALNPAPDPNQKQCLFDLVQENKRYAALSLYFENGTFCKLNSVHWRTSKNKSKVKLRNPPGLAGSSVNFLLV